MDYDYDFHYVELAPDLQLHIHTQPSWELSYVLTGSGTRLIGGVSSPFFPGDIVLVPPGIEHVWLFDPATANSNGMVENITVMFSTKLVRSIAGLFPVVSEELTELAKLQHAVTFGEDLRGEIAARLLAMQKAGAKEQIGHAVNLICRVAASLIEARAIAGSRKDSASRLKFKKVEIFVSCNYGRMVGIDDIARYLGMNKSSFCAFFKRESGTTFMNYLNDYRLEQARYLLKNSDDPINAIAYSCGFQTVTHFNHLFKSRYGVSPRQSRMADASAVSGRNRTAQVGSAF